MAEESRISQESPSGEESPSGGESGGEVPSGSAEGAKASDEDVRAMLGKLNERFEEQSRTLTQLGKMVESRTDKLEQRFQQSGQPSASPLGPTGPPQPNWQAQFQALLNRGFAEPQARAAVDAAYHEHQRGQQDYDMAQMRSQADQMAQAEMDRQRTWTITQRCQEAKIDPNDKRIQAVRNDPDATEVTLERAIAAIEMELSVTDWKTKLKVEQDARTAEKEEQQQRFEDVGGMDVLGQGVVAPQDATQTKLRAEYEAEFAKLAGMGNEGQRQLGPLKARYRARGLAV